MTKQIRFNKNCPLYITYRVFVKSIINSNIEMTIQRN